MQHHLRWFIPFQVAQIFQLKIPPLTEQTPLTIREKVKDLLKSVDLISILGANNRAHRSFFTDQIFSRESEAQKFSRSDQFVHTNLFSPSNLLLEKRGWRHREIETPRIILTVVFLVFSASFRAILEAIRLYPRYVCPASKNFRCRGQNQAPSNSKIRFLPPALMGSHYREPLVKTSANYECRISRRIKRTGGNVSQG